jgi:hypothetical protein
MEPKVPFRVNGGENALSEERSPQYVRRVAAGVTRYSQTNPWCPRQHLSLTEPLRSLHMGRRFVPPHLTTTDGGREKRGGRDVSDPPSN